MKSLEHNIRNILLEKNKENLKKKKQVIPPKDRPKPEMSDFDPRVHLKKEESEVNELSQETLGSYVTGAQKQIDKTTARMIKNPGSISPADDHLIQQRKSGIDLAKSKLQEGMVDTASSAGSKSLQKTRDGILKSTKPQAGSDQTVQMPVPKPLLSPHTMLSHPSFVMNPHMYLPKEKPGPEAKKSVSSARDVGNKSSKLASAAGGGKNSSTTKKKVSEEVNVKDKPKIDIRTEPAKSNLPVVYKPKELTTVRKVADTLSKLPVLRRVGSALKVVKAIVEPTPANKGENEFKRQTQFPVPTKLPDITINAPAKVQTPTGKGLVVKTISTQTEPKLKPKQTPPPDQTTTKVKEPSLPKTKEKPKDRDIVAAASSIANPFREYGAGKYLKPRLKVHTARMHVKEGREDIDAIARNHASRKEVEYVGRKDPKALTRHTEVFRKIIEQKAVNKVEKIVKERKYSDQTKRYGETVVNPELIQTPLSVKEGVVSKIASRVTPGIGAAYGAVSSLERLKQKDYPGAALSAASALPVVGIPAAVLDVARDYQKSGESGTTPMIKHPTTPGVSTQSSFERMKSMKAPASPAPSSEQATTKPSMPRRKR